MMHYYYLCNIYFCLSVDIKQCRKVFTYIFILHLFWETPSCKSQGCTLKLVCLLGTGENNFQSCRLYYLEGRVIVHGFSSNISSKWMFINISSSQCMWHQGARMEGVTTFKWWTFYQELVFVFYFICVQAYIRLIHLFY